MSTALPVLLVIAAGVTYHLAQRGACPTSPWPMLSVAYAAALASTVLLGMASGAPPLTRPSRGDVVAGLLIGLAALGVEAGYYYVYRAGWPLASASVIAGLTSTVILAVVGTTLLGEHLSAARAAGILLSGVAAVLIARG